MKKKAKADGSKKPNSLHSGQWISESTQASHVAAGNPSGSKSNSPSPSGDPPTKPYLIIWYNGEDVTGKKLPEPIYAGQEVAVTAEVRDAKGSPKKWQWTVSSITVKAFPGDKIPKIGKKTDYTKADFRAAGISVHWVDGGTKTLSVKVKVDGKTLGGATTADVIRPTAQIQFERDSPPTWVETPVPGEPPIFAARIGMKFTVDPMPDPAGVLEWVQIVDYKFTTTFQDGTMKKGHWADAQDGCIYPNAVGAETEDHPSAAFGAPMKTKQFKKDFHMWLLWKPPTGGVFVPLRKIHWWYEGTIESQGAYAQPIFKTGTYSFDADGEGETTTYPNWTQCLPKDH